MCGCECCISAKSIHSLLLSWRDRYLKKLKDLIKILKTEGLGKEKITYMKHIKIKSCHMPHGHHIYAKSHYMAKATMCAYSQSDHVLPHCKFLLRCCAKFPGINIPYQ